MRDEASLIERELSADATVGEQSGDLCGAIGAAQFFVVAECEIDGPRRTEARPEQILRGLKGRQHKELIVERATPPNEAIDDVAGNGGRAHSPSVFGSTGTTSMCSINTIGFNAASLPFQV